jgi:2-amino-4-hydroxy-6-hydroxymethyldihydropteridine diphosphokinase
MKVVIALGSNIGDSAALLDEAVEKLNEIITVTHLSTYIETEPVGGPEQPNYLNAVLIGETELDSLELLRLMLKIEAELGRTREVRWGPRTIDLDLIVAGDEVIDTPELQLPHPRAHERAFVLEPWLEIDPAAAIPGKGLVSRLLLGIHEAE